MTEETDDFLLDAFGGIIVNSQDDENDANEAVVREANASNDNSNQNKPQQNPDIQYNSRKPKWWKQVAGRTTKAQKQAISNMEAYHLPNIPWGEYYDWSEVFTECKDSGDKDKDIWLEIGFGQGENVLALAHKYPQRCIIGAEVHEPCLGKAFQRIQQALEKQQYWNDYVEYKKDNLKPVARVSEAEPVLTAGDNDSGIASDTNLYSNLRIYRGDGVKVLPRIPSNSLTAVLVTFPDPFPKKGHEQWRVIQKHSLRDIHRILKPSGRLFLATDHEVFHEWSHKIVDQVNQETQGNDLFIPVSDAPMRSEWLPAISKYEQKGWDEGRNTHLSCWEAKK